MNQMIDTMRKTKNQRKPTITTPMPVPTSEAAWQVWSDMVPLITAGSVAQSFEGRDEVPATIQIRQMLDQIRIVQVIFRQRGRIFESAFTSSFL
jgi:hypothetical protein